ncbi:MAG: TonB-dependent receptor [Sphingobacteriia bacterium]|nr:TonB-dependent receptor [Sphingobacteriia bacterium]
MKKKRKLVQSGIALITTFLFLCRMVSVAQTGNIITGSVKSKADSSRLQSITVYLKGHSTVVTLTDSLGNFKLKVPVNNGTLVFSGVGMENVEQSFTANSVLKVWLKPTLDVLNEVVVIGYGTQKRSVVSGAITSISTKDLENTSLMRADEALQGRAAGVTVMMNSGQPGTSPNIRIRGAGTFNNTDPTYVVDGFIVPSLESVNPRDIESMQVLKDAASAAIYGAAGANGVIIITTKKGKAGKMRILYDYYYGAQNLRRKLPVLNAQQYARIQNEAFFNSNQNLPFSEEDIAKMGTGTDWQREISYINAPIQQHQISLSGGSDNVTFNSSFSYFNQDGIVAKGKSNFQRYTARVNSDQKFLDGTLLMGQTINVTQVYRSSISTNSGTAGPLMSAINMDPVTPVMNDDGTFAISRYVNQEVVNPVARIYYTQGGSSYTRANGIVYGELKFLKGFALRSTIGYTINYDEANGYTPLYYLNATNYTVNTGTSKSFAVTNTLNFDNIISYTKKIKEHNFTVLAGTSSMSIKLTNVSASKSGLIYDDPNFAYLDLAKTPNSAGANGGAGHEGLLSYFGRITYDFASKYLLTGAFRVDGSDRFGPANKFGYFPSISVGWNMHKEHFMRNINWVNSLKLRASWGVNGNYKIPQYGFVSTVGFANNNYYWGNDVQQVGAVPTAISNPNVKWESTEQTNIGADAILFKDFSVTLDIYRKKTYDLLMPSLPIPLLVGNNSSPANAGTVINKGIELALGYHKIFGKLYLEMNVNGAYNQNNVIEVGGANGFVLGPDANNQMKNVTRMVVGQPLGYFCLYQMDGIFQTQAEINNYRSKSGDLLQPNAVPGDVKFRDVNGDGKIDDNDRINAGSPHPAFNYGINFSAKYKGFDFNIFFSGLAGNKIFNILHRWDLPTANNTTDILNRWHGEGTSNSRPRVATGDLNGNYTKPSSMFLEDGSYLRLKNISLGYTFNNLLKYKIQSLRLYVSGTNLFVLTKYSGFDPEVAGSALGLGIDRGVYPQPSVLTGGISVTF